MKIKKLKVAFIYFVLFILYLKVMTHQIYKTVYIIKKLCIKLQYIHARVFYLALKSTHFCSIALFVDGSFLIFKPHKYHIWFKRDLAVPKVIEFFMTW